MARIADKHGLTNRYRPIGEGKRVVRRGRPRTKLWNTTRRKNKANVCVKEESNVAIVVLVVAIGAGLCWLAPIFIPIFAGALVMGGGDFLLKRIWGLPSGRNSKPASWGWMLLTGLEMMVSFFMVVLILIGEVQPFFLVIDIFAYVFLSILILYRRNNKIKASSTEKN